MQRERDWPGGDRHHQAEEYALDTRLPIRLNWEEPLAQGVETRPQGCVLRARVKGCGFAAQARRIRLEAPIGDRMVAALTRRARSPAPPTSSAIF